MKCSLVPASSSPARPRSQSVGLMLGLATALGFAGIVPSCRAPAPDHQSSAGGSTEAPRADELKSVDLSVGAGRSASVGTRVSIHYTGWLGQAMFDTSRSRQPLVFSLGKGEVLRGWDQGIVGMKVGGKRRLTIPPALAYGERGSPGGAIPPNSTLVFEIELLDVGG